MTSRTVYGYTRSENGWTMVNRDECGIVTIPGLTLVDTAPLRRGAPLIILGAWLAWYDRNVEEITSPVWGWSATNDVPNSNHLAGTAVDVNAPRYPWGSRTMPADRITKVRNGLRVFEGTVFWGADWSRADEMHYQLAYPEGDPRNDQFARRLAAGYLDIYKSSPPPPQRQDDAMTPEQDRMLKDVARQLGPWPQLGTNEKGQPLTLVDAVAKLARDVAALKAGPQ